MRKQTKDVTWSLPALKGSGYRRPFTSSTKATSDLITLLAEEHETVQQIRNNINYDPEAVKIMDHFITNGYANLKLSEHLMK